MTTNQDILKPCPFCGGEAHSGISWVECKECPASMEGPDKEDYLTTSWNTRSTPPQSATDEDGVERMTDDLFKEMLTALKAAQCGLYAAPDSVLWNMAYEAIEKAVEKAEKVK